MSHPKQHITDLAVLCQRAGVQFVVISPGSRNAPLMRAFFRVFGDACISIVDERSAAYVGLGLARYTGSPVCLICTSGTAALNFGPALAEAYYQHISLVAITADRPADRIDKLENQTIRQDGVFRNFIRYGCGLPLNTEDAHDLDEARHIINEALKHARKGPVHINIPLDEPLYETLPGSSTNMPLVDDSSHQPGGITEELKEAWRKAERILIVCGQGEPSGKLTSSIRTLMEDPRVAVFAESIANTGDVPALSSPETLLALGRERLPDDPDLILHIGRHIVSRRVEKYIRGIIHSRLWRIDEENCDTDTFGRLSLGIPMDPAVFLGQLPVPVPHDRRDSYQETWHILERSVLPLADRRLTTLPFSDLAAMKAVLELIGDDSIINLGNSSIVRTALMFNRRPGTVYFANRGVSGIDGSLSSAVGTALASGRRTYALIGDLGFLYDSNALWNRKLPAGLRIVVFNNGGGAIFRQIKGAAEQDGFETFIEAHHPVDIGQLSKAYGLKHVTAGNLDEIRERWDEFDRESDKAAILEISTDARISQEAIADFTKPLPLH